MAYDHQAHLKLDDLQKKLDALDKKLDALDKKIDRLAEGLEVPLHTEPIHVAKSANNPLPRGAKTLNPFTNMQF